MLVIRNALNLIWQLINWGVLLGFNRAVEYHKFATGCTRIIVQLYINSLLVTLAKTQKSLSNFLGGLTTLKKLFVANNTWMAKHGRYIGSMVREFFLYFLLNFQVSGEWLTDRRGAKSVTARPRLLLCVPPVCLSVLPGRLLHYRPLSIMAVVGYCVFLFSYYYKKRIKQPAF